MALVSLLFIYLGIGAVAGTLAGLFGVGGGVVIVPALVFVFSALDLPVAILTHLAVGTSLATIVVTSISSVRAHHQKGAVLWSVVWSLAPGICLGVWLGVQTIVELSGSQLQLAIGLFQLIIAAQMGWALMPPAQRQLPGRWVLGGVGAGIGWASALFGIGGGSLTVPFLTWCQVRMQQAVATSAACGVPIALVGALSNIQTGWGHEGLPVGATGFVYWPALLGVSLASAPFAKLGAKWAHALPAATLKRAFALFLLMVGSIMIGKGLGLW